MEVDEIQAQQPPSKFPRIGNGGRNTSLAVHNLDDKEVMKMITTGGGGEAAVSTNRLNGWHHSRIIRVSRASGGKDRHSKVWTSKGLRDRRVRLSVSTAIQFYDLQDRLGYDQPSKAVEWLISAASDAISELPSLNSAFPDTPKQLSDEKRGSGSGGGDDHTFDAAELDMDGSPNCHHQPRQLSQNQQQQNKSACSSNSETSKGSGLSLSRSEIRVNRVKARERARERAAKVEKDNNDNETSRIAHVSQNAASFTELLTGGIGGHHNSSTGHHHQHHQSSSNNGEPLVFHKAAPQQQQPPMDYFGSGLLGLSSSSANRNHSSTSGFSSLPQTMFSISGHPGEMQNFSFVPDYMPVSSSGGGEYNLNFSMSTSSASGGALAGFNRGTLQSNSSQSPSLFQRFSPLDGSNNVPFFMGAAPPMENHHHHHHQHQFPAGLQLYGDGPGIQTTREKQRTDLLPS